VASSKIRPPIPKVEPRKAFRFDEHSKPYGMTLIDELTAEKTNTDYEVGALESTLLISYHTSASMPSLPSLRACTTGR
jgi:hypothetical protein